MLGGDGGGGRLMEEEERQEADEWNGRDGDHPVLILAKMRKI